MKILFLEFADCFCVYFLYIYIGIGGGAASSRVQEVKTANLDFNAVQRGDAEMENKMNRVIRACIEMGEKNPIVSIHDQGAGG